MVALTTYDYSSEVFDVTDLAQAKAIILTPEQGLDTAQRWEREAPYLLTLIGPMGITKESIVLDYGCGIGRMSKALIAAYGCRVVGVDISTNMRAMAPFYVASDRFMVCAPEMLPMFAGKFDAALAIWVLQHCRAPSEDIAMIRAGLAPGGQLFVVNEQRRVVPTRQAPWVDDGIDLRARLADELKRLEEGRLDPVVVTQAVADRTFWARYKA